MGFAALATGAAHFDSLVELAQHPESLQGLFSGSGGYPWQQVRGPCLLAAN